MARPKKIVTPRHDSKVLVPRSVLEQAADAIELLRNGPVTVGFGGDGQPITTRDTAEAAWADLRYYIKRAR